MKWIIVLLLGLIYSSTIGFSQINCTDYTLSSTTTEVFSTPGTSCPVSPAPTGNAGWTGGGQGGFLTHTFPSPRTSVNVIYAHINPDDYGTISVDGGGTMNVSLVNGCIDIVGNVIGPYTGPGNFGAAEINVTSTIPFTILTLTNNFATSGFVSGCTPIAPSLNIYLGPDTTLCQGTSLLLDATTTGCSYLWQDNSTDSTFTVTQTGTYWVEITDGSGLTASDTIVVDFFDLPTINLGNDTTLCPGQTLLLDVTTLDWSYLWQDGSINATYLVDTSGVYSVEITDQCDESATDQIAISYFDNANVDLGDDQTICDDKSIILNPYTNGTSFLWNDGSIAPSLNVDTAGIYWCEATNNCSSAVDSIAIFVENCEVILEMPNVITPNLDGANDLFIPVRMKSIDAAHLIILNRWGNIVFESSDLTEGWDGKTGGIDCDNGVYFYKVDYRGLGKDFQIHGFVSLETE